MSQVRYDAKVQSREALSNTPCPGLDGLRDAASPPGPHCEDEGVTGRRRKAVGPFFTLHADPATQAISDNFVRLSLLTSPVQVTRFVNVRELLVIPIRPMRPYLPPVTEAYHD
ncbi:MAG: hypothetical protein V7604_4721 [Hyphomicrobiales bacterium]|jgi:hypothetical protein